MLFSFWRCIKFDPVNPAPVVPAPTVSPDVAALTETVKTLTNQINALKEQIPSSTAFIAKIAHDTFDKRTTKKDDPPNAPNVPPAAPKDVAEASAIWETKFQSLRTELETEKATGALATAIATKAWFDPEDAIKELKPLIKKDGDKFVIPIPVLVEGVTTEKKMTMKEAVDWLAEKKAYLIKKEVKGGVEVNNNSGSATAAGPNVTNWQPKTLKEAMAYPDKWYALKRENPALATKLQQEGRR